MIYKYNFVCLLLLFIREIQKKYASICRQAHYLHNAKIFTNWPTLRSDPFVFRYVDTLGKVFRLPQNVNDQQNNQGINSNFLCTKKKTERRLKIEIRYLPDIQLSIVNLLSVFVLEQSNLIHSTARVCAVSRDATQEQQRSWSSYFILKKKKVSTCI